MRHARSINLTGGGTEFDAETIDSLPQWYVLVAECGACGHAETVERRDVMRKFGKGIRLPEVAKRLRCRCGNEGNNTLRLGKLAR